MESKDLYQQLLGLSTPWMVERVELDMTKQYVDVYVAHPKGTRFACPQCGSECSILPSARGATWIAANS
jgi:transposase